MSAIDERSTDVPFPQREIYDERYAQEGYDRRSEIRVLRAEAEVLADAVTRVLATPASGSLSILDWGVGTGRVTLEFLSGFPKLFPEAGRPLRVVAYDVSLVGLQKAADTVAGMLHVGPVTLGAGEAGRATTVGALSGAVGGVPVEIIVVHGDETESPEDVAGFLRAVNGGPYDVVSSWYSALGHIQGGGLRTEWIRRIAGLASDRGELILSVASKGDLVQAQADSAAALEAGTARFPIEVEEDTLYETELGQQNFWHVFGEDLNAGLEDVTVAGQSWWVQGIRCPDEEFTSPDEELANYQEVRRHDAEKGDERWTDLDFRKLHTVVGRRSGAPRALSS